MSDASDHGKASGSWTGSSLTPSHPFFTVPQLKDDREARPGGSAPWQERNGMQHCGGGLKLGSRTRAVKPIGLLVSLLVLVGVASAAMPSSSMAATPDPVWTDKTPADPANSPPAREGASMAFDPSSGEIVLFGGSGYNGLRNDTWTYDGTNWTQQTPPNSPPARYLASMAFDPSSGEIVLYGGFDNSGFRNDTWTYDGTNWTQQTIANSPPARYGASMAFDPSTGEVVLFGGFDNSGPRNDTWTYDGTNWAQQTTANSPPARYVASMAFDPSTGEIVLFGGSDNSGFRNDTWTYDGTNWTQQTTANSPPARYGASMAFDPSTGEIVLFGGFDNSGFRNDTWTYDGTNWTQQTIANSPPARYGASMAFDPSTGEVVLFGGFDNSGPRNDTWTYGPPADAASDWSERAPATSPPARAYASMTFDPSTGEIVLFGGYGNSGLSNDTWTYDGTNWTQQTTANSPPAREGASMAFDPSTGEVVLFGGFDNSGPSNDTWTYDGTNWTQQTIANSPPARYGASMAFDPSTGEVVLFGGFDNSGPRNDTWTYGPPADAASDWSERAPATSPPARAYASMTFDPSTGEIVLFGGYGNSGLSNDTWTYDGTNWTQQTTANSPPAREGASMAFDPSTGEVVLFGGFDNSGPSNDTWTYDGTNWTQQTTANSPPARFGAATAFDPSTGEIVLFGGYDSNFDFLGDTWTYGLVAAPSVNNAPAGTNNTITINEDSTKTFAASDFGFTDPNDSPANTLSAVKITTLPSAGTLELDGAAVSAGDTVTAADIAANKLTYEPAANACGSPYASFTFQVQDDGGTANGGVDTDQSANTLTINVTCVNDAPAGTDNTITIDEDSTKTFAASDFGFTDPNDSPANTLSAVKITTLPSAGTLKLDGAAVSAGDTVTAADIAANELTYEPAANACGSPYASFTFQVQDDGGTANGGDDTDQSANTLTVNVACVNDAPAGTDNTITINEDSTKTFAASDFGFTDPNDSPANTLSAVKITTLPSAGTLELDGAAVSAGDTVTAADIAANKLTYEPAANACGSPYASFTFQVQDDGGTANGGVDTDQSANTLTVNVACVNDAPTNISLSNNTIAENTPRGTDVGELSSTDADVPAQAFTYSLVSGDGDTHNNDFQINGTTLEVKNPLDFEAGATRTVRIRTTDNGSPDQSFEKQFTITVTDVNETPPDADGDGVADATDNCPSVANANQTNTDSDAQGDACDQDDDNDTVNDSTDACPQGTTGPGDDLDGDGCKSTEDADDDGDGVADATDNCPVDANPAQADLDADGRGDACDPTDDRPGAAPAPNAEPETTIGHHSESSKRQVTRFGFRSSIAGSTFTCQLDEKEPRPCSARKRYRKLDAGRHVFKVFATSPQGVSDPTPAKARFRIAG